MAREKTVYVCQNCGQEYPKWSGQCAGCGKWNSLVETVVSAKRKTQGAKLKTDYFVKPVKLSQVESKKLDREKTGIGELDRVLGGGMVPGSVVLVAGSPGMGKSTLLTQLALEFTGSQKKTGNPGSSVIYVCGEESPTQVKLRTERLLAGKKPTTDLLLLPETNTESIISSLEHQKPDLVIVDSIQTLWTERLTGVAGSVGQVRESANLLTQYAKANQVPLFLVGHVTKEGSIAGPKVLEHVVDVVLYLEGDGKHEFRLVRTVKNRFGSTDEVGVFTMGDQGMAEVTNPSEIFLPETTREKNPGSVVTVSLQGVRPVLVEIQALVTLTSINIPRRVGTGVDQRRLQVLCAILQKHTGLRLSDRDVYVNVAGGLTLREPAADLAICLAVASSYKDKPVKQGTVAIGEVGLLGEIRRVSFLDKRFKEAKSQGFSQIVTYQTASHIRVLFTKLLK
jgi:DNA repair protein RadA/Sms